jgi:pimeloyl-ACP methyl ester carboxylesterase
MNQEITIPWPATECATDCAAESSVRLEAALEQFEREAELGVLHTGRYRCRYYVWGEGPPLVFVHGLSDDARSFVMPVSVLSKYFRCVAYDLPTGRDDDARLGRYRHRDYLDDLFALVDHLGLDEAYLYGSSFGSTIVLKALHAMPERFPRGVLQGGFAYRRLAPAEILLVSMARYWPGAMHQLPFREATLRHSHYLPFTGREAAAWSYFVERCSSPPMAAVSRRALTLHGVDLRPALPDIHQPVLVLCGEGDPLVNRVCEEDLLRGLPHASRAEIRGCGHYPYFSHPEVLAELVLRFLTPLPCQSGH